MNKVIMGWSNSQFYDNKLVAHESVADWVIETVKSDPINRCPFVFYDTSRDPSMGDVRLDNNFSGTNPGEARLI
jgi:superfamily I DNA and/or RNA helicase